MLKKSNFFNYFLCNLPIKLPVGKCHYITGKNITTFKNLSSIENSLTTLTCNLKGFCNNLFYK